MRVMSNGATPTTLIKSLNGHSELCEGGEEFVVAVAVVIEAVDEDQCCDWSGIWLKRMSV